MWAWHVGTLQAAEKSVKNVCLSCTFVKHWPEGTECPSFLLLLITSHLPLPHPSALSLFPIILPSSVPFAPWHLSRSLSYYISFHLSGVAVPLFFVIPWPYLSSLSFCAFCFLLPCCPLTLLSSLLLSAAQAGYPMDQCSYQKPRDSRDTSTRLTSLPSTANKHWCRRAAHSCRGARALGW